ncbi:choice-of-anchor J domain-containing protein, partial [Myroides indicus]
MNKKTIYVILVFFLLTVTFGFSNWINKDQFSFKENDVITEEKLFKTEQKTQSTFACASPSDQGVKNLKSDEATIYWDDDSGTAWEYIIQLPTAPYPTGSGTPTTVKEVTITQDSNGNNLQPNTTYEFYVRTDCGTDGQSSWLGPFEFKTICGSFVPFFQEDFDSSSATFNCWSIIDNNNDGTSIKLVGGVTSWLYQGDRSLRFQGIGGVQHDEWLISPSFKLDNREIYQLSYYYHTDNSITSFEVLLSSNGTNINNFTNVLQPNTIHMVGSYQKKTLYIQNIEGEINIAWHITSNETTTSTLFLDFVTIEKINCIGPDEEIIISDISTNDVTVEWNDTVNANWEYYVQIEGGGTPIGTGLPTTSNKVDIISDQSGTTLQPDTEYEIYIRSSCGKGLYSRWIGPIVFKTACPIQPLPFWEGFNTTSTTKECWRIIDNNKDVLMRVPVIYNKWSLLEKDVMGRVPNPRTYEGDSAMNFQGLDTYQLPHDDWLISPTFQLDDSKFYRLKYFYRVANRLIDHNKVDYRVLLSSDGREIKSFTIVLDSKKEENNHKWKEENLIIGGIGGDINIAWHINTNKAESQLLIDNVFLEEISGCPEPHKLGYNTEDKGKVKIYWEDSFGSDWEYIVQKSEGNTPLPTTKGTETKSDKAYVDKDVNGDNLEPNTEYEFYVRTDCGNGEYSVWSGPYLFKTDCKVYNTPFWEGFNLESVTINCWTIIDENNDMYLFSNKWNSISTITHYEGSRSMGFTGEQYNDSLLPHNDWLISPTIKFELGKTYRLKYHYRSHPVSLYAYDFEVLLSNSGIDYTNKFTTVVTPKKQYDPTQDWTEEYTFISGISGNTNIAWHVISKTNDTSLYIDNVFIEEVTGCREPLPSTMGVKDEENNKVTIFWDDEFGATAWEYYVQEVGEPTPTGSGTATKNKENTVSKDENGKILESNKDYEFYVRTNCGDGEFSIWQGPFHFQMFCGIVKPFFWEGFNKNSETSICWINSDGDGMVSGVHKSDLLNISLSTSGPFEGDANEYLTNVTEFLLGEVPENKSKLISPLIQLDGGTYMLSYNYIAPDNLFSLPIETFVEMSISGIDNQGKVIEQKLIDEKIYSTNSWQEEVLIISGISGKINLEWGVRSSDITMGLYALSIDNFIIEEINTCPRPHNLTVSNRTSTSFDVEWDQYGDNKEWEVIVVEYGEDETYTPAQTLIVNGKPKISITGLNEGKVYTIYIRVKCGEDNSKSDWSTPFNTGTTVGASNDCSGAINIPVNDSLECTEYISTTLLGATLSSSSIPRCASDLKNDIWLEFTAKYESHVFRLEGLDTSLSLEGAIYISPCNLINAIPLECFQISSLENGKLFTGLIPGQNYYIRLGTSEKISDTLLAESILEICITPSPYLEINLNNEKHTAEELLKNILIKSNCDIISNVRYQAGDGKSSINSLAYFNSGISDFPFEEGIVLATHNFNYIAGPYQKNIDKERIPFSNGDTDLNILTDNVGGVGSLSSKAEAVLEFDFIPIKDSLQFEYLFASDTFSLYCNDVCNPVGAIFTIWLKDLKAEKSENIAIVPGTKDPIINSTIRDQKKSNTYCESTNSEYFWKNFAYGTDNPLNAPVNYAGMTIPMKSEKTSVIPGRKYRIKLAVADYCFDNNDASAVFLNGGSFNTGSITLGSDLLIETNNALCYNQTKIINSQTDISDLIEKQYEWYKNGVLISGASTADLEVSEAGEYMVVMKLTELNCEFSDTILVEVYPPISEVVQQPEAIQVCHSSLQDIVVNLKQAEKSMF